MAEEAPASTSPSPRFPGLAAWLCTKPDAIRLFKCIEVAEAAVLVRLDEIRKDSDHQTEREAIGDALTRLDLLMRKLGFS
jgi:hypothetical protein